MIVFDSADVDSAVEGVVDAIWFNQGQVSVYTTHVSCTLQMRLYVQAIKLIIEPHVITVKQGKYGRGNCQKLNLG